MKKRIEIEWISSREGSDLQQPYAYVVPSSTTPGHLSPAATHVAVGADEPSPSNRATSSMKPSLWLLLPMFLAGCESFCPQPYYPSCSTVITVPVSPCDRGRLVPVEPVAPSATPSTSTNPYDQPAQLLDEVETMSRRLDQVERRIGPQSTPLDRPRRTP